MLIIWAISSQKKKERDGSNSSVSNKDISEEKLHEIQTNFEKTLEDTFLPDAISGNEIYIFQNLMSKWFLKISAANRYDDILTQKLRHDWVDYMTSLKDRSTYNYLSLESENEEADEGYRNDHINASRKVFAIEDAFAKMVDDKAVKELKKVRSMSPFDFDENGIKKSLQRS